MRNCSGKLCCYCNGDCSFTQVLWALARSAARKEHGNGSTWNCAPSHPEGAVYSHYPLASHKMAHLAPLVPQSSWGIRMPLGHSPMTQDLPLWNLPTGSAGPSEEKLIRGGRSLGWESGASVLSGRAPTGACQACCLPPTHLSTSEALSKAPAIGRRGSTV